MNRIIRYAMLLTLGFCACTLHGDSTEIIYPVNGVYGENILAKFQNRYTSKWNSLSCNIPEDNTLEVVLTSINPGPNHNGVANFGYDISSAHNWAILRNSFGEGFKRFVALELGYTHELRLFCGVGLFQVEYFENGAEEATFSKFFRVEH